MKCEGLGDEELRRKSSPPSTLSLMGLVRHMAEVERHWFRRTVGGADVPHVWSDRHDFQAAYDAHRRQRARRPSRRGRRRSRTRGASRPGRNPWR